MNDEYGYSEGGEAVDRRAGERRAAAPVVAVVAADLSSLPRYRAIGVDGEVVKLSDVQALATAPSATVLTDEQIIDICKGVCGWLGTEADSRIVSFARAVLASQAQAAVSAPVQMFLARSTWPERNSWTEISESEYAELSTAEGYEVRRVFAAQAAVGVASQQEQQPQPSCNAALHAAPEVADLPALPDPIEFDNPTLNSEALGCGIEDRGIHDRYEAAEYGWGYGVDRAFESLPLLYTAEQMHQYALDSVSALNVPRVRGEGENKDSSASPDLASIASQAQGESYQQALEFADVIISGMFEGTGFDGAYLQEVAETHGLIKEETMAERCGESCGCAENGADFPTSCFRKTYLAALRPAPTPTES